MKLPSISKDNGTLITLLSVGAVGAFSSLLRRRGKIRFRDLGAADLSAATVEAIEDVGAGAMNRRSQLSLFPWR